jgi:hypothetical protein
VLPAAAPTLPAQATNKAYVDSRTGGLMELVEALTARVAVLEARA